MCNWNLHGSDLSHIKQFLPKPMCKIACVFCMKMCFCCCFHDNGSYISLVPSERKIKVKMGEAWQWGYQYISTHSHQALQVIIAEGMLRSTSAGPSWHSNPSKVQVGMNSKAGSWVYFNGVFLYPIKIHSPHMQVLFNLYTDVWMQLFCNASLVK